MLYATETWRRKDDADDDDDSTFLELLSVGGILSTIAAVGEGTMFSLFLVVVVAPAIVSLAARHHRLGVADLLPLRDLEALEPLLHHPLSHHRQSLGPGGSRRPPVPHDY